jgi:glycosyltransferase involved in cell wall biosynthesis
VAYMRIGLTPDWMAQGLRIQLHRRLMGRARAIIAVADSVAADTARRFNLDAKRITVIPNAVDPARVKPLRSRGEVRSSLGVPEDAAIVLFAGALNEEKNPLAVVEIAVRVRREVPGTIFLIAGEGPERARLEQRIEACLSERAVIMLGARGDLPDLMNASDALVCTSRTEGLPGLLIEAGLLGLPVVGFDVGGVSEVVVDGSTGLLAPPGDLDLISKQLVRMLSDETLTAELAERAESRCKDRFDIAPVARRYRSLYESLAAGIEWHPEEIASPTYEETTS